jgi:hypothetical protein
MKKTVAIAAPSAPLITTPASKERLSMLKLLVHRAAWNE